MTTAAITYPYGGSQPLGNSSSFIEVADNDVLYRPIIPVGTVLDYVDPYYGGGRVIRLSVPKNTTAFRVGTLALAAAATNAGITSNFSYVPVPATASQNKPVFVSINAVPLNASFAQYAWFAINGTLPIWALAATAITDKMHISATAGAAFVTPTIGRLLIGLTPLVASSGTVVKQNVRTVSGSPLIYPANSDGWFVGQSVSGTGIATSLITAISAESANPTVTLALSSTASGSVAATATNNDTGNFFPICQFFPGITSQFLAT